MRVEDQHEPRFESQDDLGYVTGRRDVAEPGRQIVTPSRSRGDLTANEHERKSSARGAPRQR